MRSFTKGNHKLCFEELLGVDKRSSVSYIGRDDALSFFFQEVFKLVQAKFEFLRFDF